MTTETTTRPLDGFLELLQGVQIDGPSSWKAYCPIHEGDGGQHTPSLQVTEAGDGKILVFCHVCKDPNIGPRICNQLGISIRALFPDWGLPSSKRGKARKKPAGKKTAEYFYRDVEGVEVFKVSRYESADGSKTFVQSRPNGRGGWINNMRGVRRIPYNLPAVVAADKSVPIFVVEGEKKVEALKTWGLVATCNVGGAGKWNAEFATYFRGRRVIILPDNDPVDQQTGRRPGQDHAAKVLASVKPVAESVRILDLPDLPEKGDIVDWQAAGRTLTELLALVAAVEAGELVEPETTGAVAQLDPLSIQLLSGRTDAAAGRRLIAAYGKNVKFCGPMKKWMIWTGKRWTIDQKCQVDRWQKTCTVKLWESVEDMGADVSADLKDKMKNWCKYADSFSGMINAVRMACSEPDIQILPDQLDGNPWLFNARNGTIDLKTGELHPHERDDLLSKISPINFDPDAECPTWERFVRQVFRDDSEIIDYMQRLCGYWATGVIREQMLPILWGGGANGKTTFLNAIMDVLGRDYTMKAPQDFLMVKHGDSHPTEKADLFGKRFVACSETDEGKRLSESMVKELTGTERIRARRMREDFWEFDSTHKVALVTNHKPVVTGSDHGIWRRIRLIEFGAKFWDPDSETEGPAGMRQDKELKDRLIVEYPGILRWIVQGCVAWQRDGEKIPESIKTQTSEYQGSQDVVGQWIDERCDIRDNATEQASDLYKSFRAWCEAAGEYVVSQKRFGASLADRGFVKQKSSSWWYIGIELLPEQQSTLF